MGLSCTPPNMAFVEAQERGDLTFDQNLFVKFPLFLLSLFCNFEFSEQHFLNKGIGAYQYLYICSACVIALV